MNTPFLLFCIGCALCGILGILATAIVIKNQLAELLSEVSDRPTFKDVHMTCDVRDHRDKLVMSNTWKYTAEGMTAKVVEKWLADRKLVMSPAGQDYSVKVKL